jgi:hypothetical protein
MIVFVIIILIVILFKDIIKETYNIWKSNPYIRYGKYKVKELVTKYGKTIRTHNKKKYTVVYMPQNDNSTYLRMSGSNTK